MGMAAAELHEGIAPVRPHLGGNARRDAAGGFAVAEFVDVLHPGAAGRRPASAKIASAAVQMWTG